MEEGVSAWPMKGLYDNNSVIDLFSLHVLGDLIETKTLNEPWRKTSTDFTILINTLEFGFSRIL